MHFFPRSGFRKLQQAPNFLELRSFVSTAWLVDIVPSGAGSQNGVHFCSAWPVKHIFGE